MKQLLLYPLKKLKYSWGGLAVMLSCGIYLAYADMPGFLTGFCIGLIVVYLALIIYRLISKL